MSLVESHVVKYWGKGFSSKGFFVIKHMVIKGLPRVDSM